MTWGELPSGVQTQIALLLCSFVYYHCERDNLRFSFAFHFMGHPLLSHEQVRGARPTCYSLLGRMAGLLGPYRVRNQATSRTGLPRTSILGSIPRPGKVLAAMKPFTRCGAPVAVLTVT